MARDRRWSPLTFVVLSVSLTATGLAQVAPQSKPLGQVVSASARIDGLAVPSGTTLMSGNVVQTGEDPASLHLTGHPVVQLGRRSSAKAEATPAGAVKVTVQSGTLSMRTGSGRAVTVPAPRLLYFSAQAAGTGQAPQDRDVVALLQAPAAEGSTSITVNDASKIDASQPIRIRRPGGDVEEIHYIRSIKERTLTLTAPVGSQFPAESQVLQGESTRALLSEPEPATGRPQPGTVSRPRAGGPNIPLIVVLAGAGVGATTLLLYDGSEPTSASPSRP